MGKGQKIAVAQVPQELLGITAGNIAFKFFGGRKASPRVAGTPLVIPDTSNIRREHDK
jgi:hypothetical protein